MGRQPRLIYGNIAGTPVHLCRVYLNRSGYDNGGAYWGLGAEPLYRAYAGKTLFIDTYYCATSRIEAKQKVLADMPGVRFYR